MTIDQQFIEYVVKSIVSNPDDVQIERTIDEKGVLLELTVNPEDLGRVIGKRGNTAQSMRTLLRALGTKNDARYNLKIIDNGEPKPERRKREDTKKSEDAPSEPTAATAAAGEASAGANQWAHLSSSSDEDNSSDNAQDSTDEDDESSTASTSSRVEQTKKELADLDDIGL